MPATLDSPYSTDSNLWGRSIECGVLEDPWLEPPDDIYTLTRAPADCPDEPAYVEIEFDAGVPVRTNGIDMPLLELIESLETIAGTHGVGRIDMVENRLVGHQVARDLRSAGRRRAARGAPGAREPRHRARSRIASSTTWRGAYADSVYNGLWFSPTREAIDAFVAPIQQRVTGAVRLKLFKGDCRVVGRKSPFALYDHGLATYDSGDRYDHSAAEGFIKIWGLPIETAARKAAGAPRSGRSAEWRTSGPAASTAIPTPRCSSSAPRSDSIGVCSKTM